MLIFGLEEEKKNDIASMSHSMPRKRREGNSLRKPSQQPKSSGEVTNTTRQEGTTLSVHSIKKGEEVDTNARLEKGRRAASKVLHANKEDGIKVSPELLVNVESKEEDREISTCSILRRRGRKIAR